MTEKLNYLKESGAVFFPPATSRALELANAAFQQMRASVLPKFFADFYLQYGGALLGDACVFPIEDKERPDRSYTIPGIVKINRDLAAFRTLRGKTVWGRNQMYVFSCDVLDNLYMHDVMTLQVLRKYGDLASALTDCMLVGKI
ncbi:MAG: hypothetical protein LBQ49_00715 [Rickettsiales bacterium]|jgi:hypothetical protein|nr:hypothetical protein [Rickettsiales bacterium]